MNSNISHNNINTNLNSIDNNLYLITKYETNIKNLESQRNSIIYLIESLTKTNYTFNYSKINLLKHSLTSVSHEINKNQISIMREKNNQKLLNKNKNILQYQQPQLYREHLLNQQKYKMFLQHR